MAARKVNAPLGPVKSWAESNIIAAVAAFRELTGKSAAEPEAQAAWSVVWQALLSIGEPTQERSEWLTECAKPFHASLGVRKARVLPVLWALKPNPKNYRKALEKFDARFGKLTDEEILDAFGELWRRREKKLATLVAADTGAANKKPSTGLGEVSPKGWFAAIARVSLIVRGFDVARRADEDVQEAVDRIANTFRTEYDLHVLAKSKLKKPRK